MNYKDFQSLVEFTCKQVDKKPETHCLGWEAIGATGVFYQFENCVVRLEYDEVWVLEEVAIDSVKGERCRLGVKHRKRIMRHLNLAAIGF